jgi:hypothetical protein
VCDVRVEFAGESTQHTVTVSAAEVARWSTGAQRKDVEELVVRSFEFLLEREPPSSILRRFELSAIQRYFPEYDREFRLGRGGKP